MTGRTCFSTAKWIVEISWNNQKAGELKVRKEIIYYGITPL